MSKNKDEEQEEQAEAVAQLVVTVVTAAGETHTYACSLPAAAADSKHTSPSGVGKST